MIKVLMIYESLATPSTMVRGLQFTDCFAADDKVNVRFMGRTSERMNRVMQRWPYRPMLRRPMSTLESSICRRREERIVEQAKQSDIVVMMTVPSIELHRRLDDLPNCVLVMDLIDALWLPAFQAQGWQEIETMLRTSDAVICENEFTAEYTRQRNENVFVQPDAPQVEVFDRHRHEIKRSHEICRIGWIGGKYTADALYQVFEPLEQLFADRSGLELRLVGADPDRIPRFENVRYSVVPTYDQTLMVQEALAMHIGIFPMFDVQESLYRGSLKSRIYMAGEAAVIGQDLGDNQATIDHGNNGLLASGNESWLQSLTRLIDDAAYRNQLAAGGLAMIRNRCDRESTYQNLRKILLQLA